MEEASGRSTNPVGFLRRGSGISLRNQSDEERPSQYSNKPGKTTNLNTMKARWADNKGKPRHLHEPFQSPGSKASSSSSSKGPVRKYYEEKQKLLAEVHSSEGSNRRAEVRHLQSGKKAVVYEDGHPYTRQNASEGSSSSTITEGGLPEEPDLEVLDPSVSSGISAHTVDSIVRNTSLSTKPRRQKDKEELNSGRSQVASTFVRRRTAPQSSTIGVKSSSGAGTASTGLQKCGLKNLGCTSISDVLPSGCSSSDSVRNRRVEVTKKRPSDGEGSSRSRGMSGQASLGQPPAIYPGSTGSTDPRARAAEQSASQQTARTSSRSFQYSADSGRTRRSSTQPVRERMPGEREGGIFALRETVTRVRHVGRGHFSMDDVSPQRLARPFHAKLPHAIYSSNRQGSSSHTTSSRPEGSPPQMFHGLLPKRDGYRRINMEGIAEVLLALDRIEQYDELTYEQLLVLETNLLLSGLGLNDQHQDMRLDIDNMSYEELLALEEQIGSVSTALSEEQFAKCVSRSVYKARNSEREVNKIVVDDVKCSICQEEYIEGEEIGRMQCEHRYHVSCIHEWLRQKNWCPICKASAIPSEMD
ncbi:uncharacterized protein LOC133931402 isoform X2 [Phragmites australis]|nr:uncharacterized protein LOC133931402 isoform X2 [Phragmites australis]